MHCWLLMYFWLLYCIQPNLELCPAGDWKQSTLLQGGVEIWKLKGANKLPPCIPYEDCLHAAFTVRGISEPSLSEGRRTVSSSEGNPAALAAVSEQRKLASWWSVLCPLVCNYLYYSLPSACFRVTDSCATYLWLCARFYYYVFFVLKCSRGQHLLHRELFPSAHRTDKNQVVFCGFTHKRMCKV